MKLSFEYAKENIELNVIFRKRTTMEIRVEYPGLVTVLAPQELSKEVILEKVKIRAKWISKHLNTIKNVKCKKADRKFVSGESFMYLGNMYQLQVVIDKNIKKSQVNLFDDKIIVTTMNEEPVAIRKAMEKWYRLKAKEKVEERIAYYQRFFSITPAYVRVKEQKRIWGSCTSKNVLNFNWRIVMAELPALDYIVVHEMCHMEQHNHSKKYWELVASIMPDYKIRKEWLKRNGVSMDL